VTAGLRAAARRLAAPPARGIVALAVAGALLVGSPSGAGAARGASPTTGAGALRAAAAAAAPALGPSVDPHVAPTAIEAYVWGAPLVTMMRTRARSLCLAPVNTLLNAPTLAGPGDRLVVTPNADTLYSNAWLDLRRGPIVLSVPASDRYYVFQFLDMYTNTIANVGTRTNGNAAGRYAITGPGWHGPLPAGTHHISSPTPDVWVIGRTLVTSPTDLPAAAAQQHRDTLQPLGPAGPATGTELPGGCSPATPSNTTFVADLVAAMTADPPPRRDAPIVADLAAVGIGPGLTPAAALDAALLTRATTAGLALVARNATAELVTRHGWSRLPSLGTYGTDYVARAATAATGLGADVPAEAVYFQATHDSTGTGLSGSTAYRIHFAARDLPPIDPRAFWSVTAYGPDHFLVANAIGRYSLGDRTRGLRYGPDGSLDLYLATQPPAGHETNWLPTPAGPFSLVLRTYLPAARIRDGGWVPPVVQPG